MTIEQKIEEFKETILEKIKKQSEIKEAQPSMHWSSEEYKQFSRLDSEISDLRGKIQCLEDNEDISEVDNILKTNEWSWISKKFNLV